MAILSQGFYLGDTVDIARRLLGKYLVRRLDGETLVCRLTETEAYVGRCDKACHAYNYRRTARTDALFQPPGRAYVYLIYGMYDCLNIVTEPEGEPSAVLLRGAAAISGGETMARLRYGDKPMTAARQKKKNRRAGYCLSAPGGAVFGLCIWRCGRCVLYCGDQYHSD